jgi:hypothetical protein
MSFRYSVFVTFPSIIHIDAYIAWLRGGHMSQVTCCRKLSRSCTLLLALSCAVCRSLKPALSPRSSFSCSHSNRTTSLQSRRGTRSSRKSLTTREAASHHSHRILPCFVPLSHPIPRALGQSLTLPPRLLQLRLQSRAFAAHRRSRPHHISFSPNHHPTHHHIHKSPCRSQALSA